MKRKTAIIALLLVMLTFFASVSSNATANDATFLLGDADGDGDISITDATLIQRDVVQLQLLPAGRRNAADTDHDGYITVMDSSMIQRWLVHMAVFYPIAENVSASYLDSIYPITSPSESIEIAPTSAPTQAIAELSSDGKTVTAHGVDFDIADIPDSVIISGDERNVSQYMLLKPKSEVSPEDITIQIITEIMISRMTIATATSKKTIYLPKMGNSRSATTALSGTIMVRKQHGYLLTTNPAWRTRTG